MNALSAPNTKDSGPLPLPEFASERFRRPLRFQCECHAAHQLQLKGNFS